MVYCFDTPIEKTRRCLWCGIRDMCRYSDGTLASRNSMHCRFIVHHLAHKNNPECNEGEHIEKID